MKGTIHTDAPPGIHMCGGMPGGGMPGGIQGLGTLCGIGMAPGTGMNPGH